MLYTSDSLMNILNCELNYKLYIIHEKAIQMRNATVTTFQNLCSSSTHLYSLMNKPDVWNVYILVTY